MSDEWKTIWKIALFLIAFASIAGIVTYCGRGTTKVIDNAFINYEEFHDLYNDIKAIDQKICNINKIPADDGGFKYQSKQTQVTGLRNLMERRISEYNSKSSQWHRDLWKSKDIPQRLEADNFKCYPQETK